jgi:hypothetical protein
MNWVGLGRAAGLVQGRDDLLDSHFGAYRREHFDDVLGAVLGGEVRAPEVAVFFRPGTALLSAALRASRPGDLPATSKTGGGSLLVRLWPAADRISARHPSPLAPPHPPLGRPPRQYSVRKAEPQPALAQPLLQHRPSRSGWGRRCAPSRPHRGGGQVARRPIAGPRVKPGARLTTESDVGCAVIQPDRRVLAGRPGGRWLGDGMQKIHFWVTGRPEEAEFWLRARRAILFPAGCLGLRLVSWAGWWDSRWRSPRRRR